MEDIPINVLDIVILVVAGLSAIVGLIRGFVREVLSLAAWIGAGWLALTFYPDSRVWTLGYIENEMWASIVAGGGSFLFSLVVLTIIARLISKMVQSSALVGPLDRTLGMLFGILRGAVLVILGYTFTMMLVDEDSKKPQWAADSRLLPQVEEGAVLLLDIVPADITLPELEFELPDEDIEDKSGADTNDEFGYTPDEDIGQFLKQKLRDQMTPENE
ncbi:MAG: CvpA family protein [Alphaproteobacteria bacterium]|nr:MAG: CvpA family protein [Alphaproteobacteria bacterium]